MLIFSDLFFPFFYGIKAPHDICSLLRLGKYDYRPTSFLSRMDLCYWVLDFVILKRKTMTIKILTSFLPIHYNDEGLL